MEEHVGLVYLVRNRVTGKKYVGQTIYSLRKRWKGHCHPNSGCKVLRRAILKYGAESFEISTLESGLSRGNLNEREKYWIGELKTRVPLGYNLLDGGNSTDLVNTSRSKTRKATLAALAARGLPKGKSPLTESDVREMFSRHNLGDDQKDIAKHFDVHKSTVSHIIEGKNWGHLGLVSTRIRSKAVNRSQAVEVFRLNSLDTPSRRIGKLIGLSKASVDRVLRGALFPEVLAEFGERRHPKRVRVRKFGPPRPR
jgi:group I intron endonuclease